MPIDPRFLSANAREIFNGNELLVKGCLEVDGGVHLLTGYPGSPVAGFFDSLGSIKDLLREKGVRAYQANNEALAAASINGVQMIAGRAVCAMKSVGLHVAADALALGTLAGPHPDGGGVIIVGDDPWCESTQVPADSRFLCEHLRMAVLEPGTPQELKDWIDLSFKLSRMAGLYIGYVVTPAHADGGGTVWCKPNQFPSVNMNRPLELETAKIPLDKVLLPPRTWQRELTFNDRFALACKAARELGINRLDPRQNCANGEPAPIGFIVTGMAGPYLRHVLADIGLDGAFPILELGLSYPADVQFVKQFSGCCRQMIVIEERRSFLEKNIRDGLFREFSADEAAAINGRLFGKKFSTGEGIPDVRGLNYSVLAQRIIPLIQSLPQIPDELRNGRLGAELARLRAASKPLLPVLAEKIIPRTPTFCPGCPHRDSAATLLDLRKNLADAQYMRQHHNSGPVDLVAHGDTGCYTMLMFAPTEQLMHNYSGMGLGAGTGSGVDPFITNKQIVFMGDGTFFHSGQIAITNSIKANQDITYIILQNGTTAMTGHQDHAGTEEDMFGNRHPVQDIHSIVQAMAVGGTMHIAKMSPGDRDRYRQVLEETIVKPGVKVIIADKECGITFNRSRILEERRIIKQKGFLPRKDHINITPEVCEACLECTRQTACPGLTTIETDYGRKIDTDLTWCVGDAACERVRVSNSYGTDIKPCPSFETVTIVRSRRRRYLLPNMSLDKLPDPKRIVHDMSQDGSAWRCHMSGVGGMGIGLVSAILVRAGHKQGYRVVFQEKKGLAIRNGGVFSQITFVRDSDEATKRRSDGWEAPSRQVMRSTGGAPVPQVSNSVRSTQDSALSTQYSGLNTEHSPYSTTGNIPYGRANLLLGIDILEAARAIDPRESFRVASKEHTSVVLNLYKQPTVYTMLGRQDLDPEVLREEVLRHCDEANSYANNISEICERRLGSKQFANIMMLGVAYQLGLIPVSAHSIAWAIKDTVKREHRRNLKAFNIGRKLALEPRVLPRRPEPVTWEQLLTNKMRILRKTKLRGRSWEITFERLVRSSIAQMSGLSEAQKYDLALRIYDLMQYQDEEYARRYVELVRSMYHRDSSQRGYAATGAAIWNLAKVMLIKDEPYVSYLLTRYEKKQRDIEKYGVDSANGDKLVYRHHTNPELTIFGRRIRFKINSSDWMLRLVQHCKWLRKLPGWHARETAFREWYIGVLSKIALGKDGDYERALTILRCPEAVSGYREVRYPKLDAAREMVELELRRGANSSGAGSLEAAVG